MTSTDEVFGRRTAPPGRPATHPPRKTVRAESAARNPFRLRGTGFARRTGEGFGAALAEHDVRGVAPPCEETFDQVYEAVRDLLLDSSELSGPAVQNEALGAMYRPVPEPRLLTPQGRRTRRRLTPPPQLAVRAGT